MKTREVPIVFQCEQQSLIGVVHLPEKPKKIAIISIVAGGPQYRAGFGRQLIKMARRFSAEGISVMRFDYRGLGDSSGSDAGFENIGLDLDAAIQALRKLEPMIEGIILWGGCNAASAALIHGPHHPAVTGLILANPWVRTEDNYAKVIVRDHYSKRILEPSFWWKVLTLQYNPFPALVTLFKGLGIKGGNKPSKQSSQDNLPYIDRMLMGAQLFQGKVLLMMSDLSLTSKEFDSLVSNSNEWQKAMSRDGVERVTIKNADQAFSTHEAREAMLLAAEKWVKDFETS
ncbi:MAG: hydrolase 1, exosortase A system-associated [Pseudomonadales bacterium]|nr:hydrolase 1, exosortase A system-associated [Pseudomonadales bacterium]